MQPFHWANFGAFVSVILFMVIPPVLSVLQYVLLLCIAFSGYILVTLVCFQ